MRGYGECEEWTDELTPKRLKEIRRHANPPKGACISDPQVTDLRRDLRALLAELRRRDKKTKGKDE